MSETLMLSGWYRIAIAQANAGDGTSALKTLELLRESRMSSAINLQRVYAYATIGKFDEASALAATIRQENPGDERGRAYRLLGAVLTNKKGRVNAVSWAVMLPSAQDRTSVYLGVADGLFGPAKEAIPPYFED